MPNFSFDLVSDYDIAEMNNVLDQTKREIDSRYDFKNTPAAIEWLDQAKSGLKITGTSEWQIDSIIEIVRKKLASRGQSQKVLDLSKIINTNNMQSVKEVPFIKGLDHDKAKIITNMIREHNNKVKSQIQGDAIRITSSSKNELQEIMQLIKSSEFDFPVGFDNFR